MAAQNLASGTVTPETIASVTESIAAIKAGLPMLVILQPKQKKEFVKVGNTYLPFIEMGYETVRDHPNIMPGVFDVEEFKRDYQLAKDLVPILNQLSELTESVEDTIFAANSDAMSAALEIYAAVQSNKDKIPGMDTMAGKMAGFFKKTRTIPPPKQ